MPFIICLLLDYVTILIIKTNTIEDIYKHNSKKAKHKEMNWIILILMEVKLIYIYWSSKDLNSNWSLLNQNEVLHKSFEYINKITTLLKYSGRILIC